MKHAYSKFGLACAAAMIHLGAGAATLLFDDLVDGSLHQYELGGLSDVRTDLYDKGFRLVYAPAEGEPYPTGLYAVGPKWRYNGRSVAATINSCLGSLTITRQDNNPFGIESIDVSTLNGDPTAPITFYGTTTDGTVVTYSVEATGMQWTRKQFPASFSSLYALMWRQGDCVSSMPHMFDNVQLSR